MVWVQCHETCHSNDYTKTCNTYGYSEIDEPMENAVHVVNTAAGGDSQHSIALQARYPLPV